MHEESRSASMNLTKMSAQQRNAAGRFASLTERVNQSNDDFIPDDVIMLEEAASDLVFDVEISPVDCAPDVENYHKYLSWQFYNDSKQINITALQSLVDRKMSRPAQLFIAIHIREALLAGKVWAFLIQ